MRIDPPATLGMSLNGPDRTAVLVDRVFCYPRAMVRSAPFFGLLLAAALVSAKPSFSQSNPRCGSMDLPIASVDKPPTQYSDFCERHPASCVLDGEPTIEWTKEIHQRLSDVNARVNEEVELVSDMDNLGLEENWDFPKDCRGDCEDFVLEKREKLVELGFPRAALTIAIGFHEDRFFPHAVLLAETDSGTSVLDNLHGEVLGRDAVPVYPTGATGRHVAALRPRALRPHRASDPSNGRSLSARCRKTEVAAVRNPRDAAAYSLRSSARSELLV